MASFCPRQEHDGQRRVLGNPGALGARNPCFPPPSPQDPRASPRRFAPSQPYAARTALRACGAGLLCGPAVRAWRPFADLTSSSEALPRHARYAERQHQRRGLTPAGIIVVTGLRRGGTCPIPPAQPLPL